MGIKDLFNKVKNRVTGEEDFDLEEDFEEADGGFGGTEHEDSDTQSSGLGKNKTTEEDEFDELETEPEEPSEVPTPKRVQAPEPVAEELVEPVSAPSEEISAELETIQATLDTIKEKLNLLETHLESIEMKEQMNKADADQYLQYFSSLNEKLDHLEQEHSELERLLQDRV